MNNLFFLVSFILSFLNFPVHQTSKVPTSIAPTDVPFIKPDKDLIPWSANRLLNWEDFLCEPITNTDAVASTSTSLGFSYKVLNGKFYYDLDCSFSRSRSWGLLKTPYILAHEQGHFDITEIFTRKMNRALQEYQFNPKTYKKDIMNIYESIIKEKEEFQMAYDEETNHSRKKGRQTEWLDHIQKLLEESTADANYP